MTRGCIPSKMILYPAEVVNNIKRSAQFGIDSHIKDIDFTKIMEDMRSYVKEKSDGIKDSLIRSPRIDFYQGNARFVKNNVLRVNGEDLKGERIILCTGSRTLVPKIEGIEKTHYLTNKTFLELKKKPKSMIIIGGGFIAAEYGYFMAMMGTEVHMVSRSSRLIQQADPEISRVLEEKLSKHMKIYKGYEVKRMGEKDEKKAILAVDKNGNNLKLVGEEILLAAGRRSNSDILQPEKSDVEVDEKGWIKVNKYLETTNPNIWALGDATGKHMFKHVANHESRVVFNNAFSKGEKISVDYHAVPYAVFTDPEVASVGMTEEEAGKRTDISVGKAMYTDTAKGQAMKAEDCFVKVIVESSTHRILGAHIIGPHASILIQEIVNLMYTKDMSAGPIYWGMHIHPALSEVVERAFGNLHEH